MTEEYEAALIRLKRKLDVMRLDFKATNNNRKYDIEECITLLNIMERNQHETCKDQRLDHQDLGSV